MVGFIFLSYFGCLAAELRDSAWLWPSERRAPLPWPALTCSWVSWRSQRGAWATGAQTKPRSQSAKVSGVGWGEREGPWDERVWESYHRRLDSFFTFGHAHAWLKHSAPCALVRKTMSQRSRVCTNYSRERMFYNNNNYVPHLWTAKLSYKKTIHYHFEIRNYQSLRKRTTKDSSAFFFFWWKKNCRSGINKIFDVWLIYCTFCSLYYPPFPVLWCENAHPSGHRAPSQ